MKKSGFTLIEILISLAIIGCIAAFMIPAMMNSKPDNNKALFLKTYDELSQAIQALVNDSKIYPLCGLDVSNQPDCQEQYRTYPFTNTVEGSFEDGTTVNGNDKFRNALAHSLGMAMGQNSFTLPNGVGITVAQPVINENGNENWRTQITIDVNGTSGPNCSSNEDNCTQPDRFILYVAADGQLYFGDITGLGYKLSETDMRRTEAQNFTINALNGDLGACLRIPRDDTTCENYSKN